MLHHFKQVEKGKLERGEEPDRAIFWKKARLPKDNVVDDELAKVNEKIDLLLEKKSKSEFHPSGSEDVLTVALETPEHSGRVRGVGGYITPQAFFNLPKQKRVRITKSELMTRDRHRSEENEKIM